MPYEPLHHKYRPQTFAELVGQEAISRTLTNAIISRRIAPAYLFTGPRGTGKTSSARILAKSLNCLNEGPTPTPCGLCHSCQAIARGSALDVIEIDAASNTGVDNIREVIERAQFAPVGCRYKVYVIDECHMLSTAAFNALLKTLEEPPERVVFVLATTDPQRVLPTIISRCQRFDFRRIPLKAMVAHLQKIANLEEIAISHEALFLVAQIANGGLRDAQSLLDQLSLLSGTTTPERVWDLVGAVPERDLLVLLAAIAADDPEAVLEQCRSLINRGREPLVVLQNLASFILNLLIANTAPTRTDLVAVTEPTWQQLCRQAQDWELSDILQAGQQLKDSEEQLKHTAQPHLWLEVTLLGLLPSASRRSQDSEVPSVQERALKEVVAKPELTPAQPNGVKSSVEESLPSLHQRDTPFPGDRHDVPAVPLEPVAEPQAPEKSAPVSPTPAPLPVTEPDAQELWQEMLKHLHPPTTQALLSQHCQLLSFDGVVVHIGIKNKALLGIAQSKLANIEAAFELACQQKIQVKLQVIPTQSSDLESSPTGSQVVSMAPAVPKSISNTMQAAEPHPANTSQQAIAVHQNGSLPEDNPLPSPPEPASSKPLEPAVDHFQPTTAVPLPASDEPDSEADIKNAAQSLAQYFDGELVSLGAPVDSSPSAVTLPDEGDMGGSPQPPGDPPTIQGRPDLTDCDDEDIPFLRSVSLPSIEVDLQDPWEVNPTRPGVWLHGARIWL